MKDLDKKLKIIEQETIDEKIRKKALREKAEIRQSKIHLDLLTFGKKKFCLTNNSYQILIKFLKVLKK